MKKYSIDEMKEMKTEFNAKSEEEMKKDTEKSFYESVDRHIDSIMQTRAMFLSDQPEEKDAVDRHIANEAKRKMEEYDSMSRAELALRALLKVAGSMEGGLESALEIFD